MTKQATISILCENQARTGAQGKLFSGQHGLSVFIEENSRILFDTGPSNIFLHNAGLLGIDVNTADCIVLSHSHDDHTGGLKAFGDGTSTKTRLVAHPGIFLDHRKPTGEFSGMEWNREETAAKFELILSRDPYQLTNHTCFLGEIPRNNDFESQTTSRYYMDQGERHPDFLLDDTALVIKADKGLVIVTGCSHSGICNIVEYAKETTGESTVHAVIGGFHLMNAPELVKKTIAYFEKNRVEHLCPMHCTDFEALAAFHKAFGIKKLSTGDTVQFTLA